MTVTRTGLLALLAGATTPAALGESGELTVDGAGDAVSTLLDVLDPPDPDFAIVTP